MSTLAPVKSCAATACAFNKDNACSNSVTVGAEASCTTFFTLDVRAKSDVEGQVSACHRLDCAFNDALQCNAGQVSILESADCETYKAQA